MKALLIAALLTVAPGDTALEAIHQGLVIEMAHNACDKGDLFACESVERAGSDSAHLQAVMIRIVEDAQKTCTANPDSFECDLLLNLDRTASEVLEKHHYHRT